MKKIKGLLVLAVSLMLIGVTGVSAKTYDMETDMNASEFDLTEDTVINGNGHTITGRFNINTEVSTTGVKALREYLTQNPCEQNPNLRLETVLKNARSQMSRKIAEFMQIFANKEKIQ